MSTCTHVAVYLVVQAASSFLCTQKNVLLQRPLTDCFVVLTHTTSLQMTHFYVGYVGGTL